MNDPLEPNHCNGLELLGIKVGGARQFSLTQVMMFQTIPDVRKMVLNQALGHKD
ncbi:MAG: hypothetical protein ACNYPE_08645 [Candidatus Azotimanducaceae bacterium WSBS_2022_MAG_OTU7]